jgi:hypothetical protein
LFEDIDVCVKILKDRQHTDEARKELEVLQGLRPHPLLALPIGCVFAGMCRCCCVSVLCMFVCVCVMMNDS